MKHTPYIHYAIVVFLLALPLFVSAEDLVFYKHDIADIKITCTNEGKLCSSTSGCNLTVLYPNNTVMVNNSAMTNMGAYFNKTLATSSVSGRYQAAAFCCDGDECNNKDFEFKIMATGWLDIPQWVVVLAMGIIAAILTFIAWALDDEHIILKVFMFLISITIVIMGIPAALLVEDIVFVLYQIGYWTLILICLYVVLYSIYFILIKRRVEIEA